MPSVARVVGFSDLLYRCNQFGTISNPGTIFFLPCHYLSELNTAFSLTLKSILGYVLQRNSHLCPQRNMYAAYSLPSCFWWQGVSSTRVPFTRRMGKEMHVTECSAAVRSNDRYNHRNMDGC
jgi:hypothetical protein